MGKTTPADQVACPSATLTVPEISYKRVGHNGHLQLTAKLGRETIHTDKLEISKANNRQRFENGLCKDRADVDREAVHKRLLKIAEEMAAEKPKSIDNIPQNLAKLYKSTEHGLVYMKPTADGAVPTPLTNFAARIVGDVSKDDGAEQQHAFEIEATLAGQTYHFSVPAADFAAMNWPIDNLGAQAIVYPGYGARDHARAAIQILSRDLKKRVIYSHTGWRHTESGWIYLHGGGAIGAFGIVDGVEVALPEALAGYKLPEPGCGNRRQAIQASLKLLELAPEEITFPAFAALWRAVLGGCDFALHLAGPSGVFKSELAALLQQHFGENLDSRHLPGSWAGTDNALEGLAFAAKDAVMVIDDFAPGGTSIDVQRMHQKADRVIRSQGNQSGKPRMNGNGSLRPNKPPRGMIISTGEDIPRGYSLRSRLLILELAPGNISPNKLSDCQADARAVLYAQAMAAYVKWLAMQYQEIMGGLREEVATIRDAATASTGHRRTPEMAANLAVGLRMFLQFATEASAITKAEAQQLWQRGWDAIGKAAARQADFQQASEPTQRFLELLAAAIASGKAHLANREGQEPEEPQRWGWRKESTGGGMSYQEDWRPLVARVGWADGSGVFLEPEAAYKAAQDMAGGGEGIAITPQTLRKRLAEKGLLIREGNRDELTVRRILEGTPRRVLHIQSHVLCAEPAKPAIPANAVVTNVDSRACEGGSLAGCAKDPQKPAKETRQMGVFGRSESGGHDGDGAPSTPATPPAAAIAPADLPPEQREEWQRRAGELEYDGMPREQAEAAALEEISEQMSAGCVQ